MWVDDSGPAAASGFQLLSAKGGGVRFILSAGLNMSFPANAQTNREAWAIGAQQRTNHVTNFQVPSEQKPNVDAAAAGDRTHQ